MSVEDSRVAARATLQASAAFGVEGRRIERFGGDAHQGSSHNRARRLVIKASVTNCDHLSTAAHVGEAGARLARIALLEKVLEAPQVSLRAFA